MGNGANSEGELGHFFVGRMEWEWLAEAFIGRMANYFLRTRYRWRFRQYYLHDLVESHLQFAKKGVLCRKTDFKCLAS